MVTGTSFHDLAHRFKVGVSTIHEIVCEVTRVIWNVHVKEHMPVPSVQQFKDIGDNFDRLWDFPNCIGALDGKHVRIKAPANAGSLYYNYKHFHSLSFQALTDAQYKFIVIEVGAYGKQSDGGTFASSKLNEKISNKTLLLPNDVILPNTNIAMPYVIVADEAYPLGERLMKPYSQSVLDENENNEIFNNRLSRARKVVECSFGILFSKWRLLSSAIETNVPNTEATIKCMCILHNIIVDKENVARHAREAENYAYPSNIQPLLFDNRGRPADRAKAIRDKLRDYFAINRIVHPQQHP